MVNKTQHDLSYNHVKLDYQALLDTAIIAFAKCRNEVEGMVATTHSLDPDVRYVHDMHRLLKAAEQMVIACETMDTLKEGLTRENIEIVNKPEVKNG